MNKKSIFVENNKKMTLKIHFDDNRMDFLVELLESLKFVTIEADSEPFSEEYKEFLDARLAHHQANRDKGISWEDLKKQLLQIPQHSL